MAIQKDTVIAANRFGLGARPGELTQIGSYPREWLKAQISKETLVFNSKTIPTSKEAISHFLVFRDKTLTEIQKSNSLGVDVKDVMNLGRVVRPMYEEHILARSKQAIETDQSFRERLVHFWTNHFTVSADEPRLIGLAGTVEFEAIRPHVMGNFPDMLLAVEQHPAMLLYLDNHQSVGPDSRLASQANRRNVNRKFDINENLAREILELHTLGVDGGYSQVDVTNFARVISGWTIGGMFKRLPRDGKKGEFYFNAMLHEPGAQTILGKKYSQSGIKQGKTVLNDLALHPATARFIATKLTRHFISDSPPASAIHTLEKSYLDNDGNLAAVYERLIDMDEAWHEEKSKYKTPSEYVHSIFRAVSFDLKHAREVMNPLSILGQQPYKPGSPAGWPDTAKDWSGGESLMKRVELASTVGKRIGNRVDPDWLAEEILGPEISDHTRTEIARAESGSQGIALLFASPEFQRR